MIGQNHAITERNLRAVLDLMANAQATYLAATPSARRQLNQALFTRVRVDDDGDVTAELAEPFKTLFSPQVKVR